MGSATCLATKRSAETGESCAGTHIRVYAEGGPPYTVKAHAAVPLADHCGCGEGGAQPPAAGGPPHRALQRGAESRAPDTASPTLVGAARVQDVPSPARVSVSRVFHSNPCSC